MRGLWTRFRETGDVVKKPVLRGCPRLQNLLGATVGRCVRNEPPARECRALMSVDYPFRTSLTVPYATARQYILQRADVGRRTLTLILDSSGSHSPSIPTRLSP